MRVGFKDSIAFRMILLFTLVIVLVGALVLTSNAFYSAKQTREQTRQTVDALISTVEPHLQIATYLNDTVLSDSIALGLLANEIVASVRIVATPSESPSEEFVLAELDAENTSPDSFGEPIHRAVLSPFTSGESTGFVEVVRNKRIVDRLVKRGVVNAGVPLLVLIIFIVISLLLLIKVVVLPFLNDFSKQLNSISANKNELLECSSKHKKNELGALTHYINRMLSRLYEVRENERLLHHKNEIEHKKLQMILEKAHTGIFLMLADGRLQSRNPAFDNMVSSIPGAIDSRGNYKGDFSLVLNAQEDDSAEKIMSSLERGELVEDVLQVPDKDGKIRWLNVTLSPIEGALFQGILNEVTEHKEALIAAQTIAKTDALTGLSNRYAFDEHLEAISNAVAENHSPGFTLMFIDLDRFKPVNDIHGHEAGDCVLGVVAERLRGCVRATDFISRFGGDEFVVILTDLFDEEIVERITQKIIDEISLPILFENSIQLQIGASIGISFMKAELKIDKETLLQQADEAMYKVKEQGRGRFFIYKGNHSQHCHEEKVSGLS